jgi:penicillin-binding protein 1A
VAFRPFRILLILAGTLAVAGVVALGVLYLSLVRDLPDFETLADYRPPLTTTVLDRNGRPIAEFYEFRRQLTPLQDVPQQVIDAFLAAEDDTFYEHGGVDYVSILRAAWANLLAGGETVQGASTITQQMVKQLLLSPERTYTRKLREMLLARRIEQRFSKDDILYLYLNQIYFGSGAYGIGEAARTYFGKPLGELDASEAALLAGLPKAPGRNSPFLNPERAEERRRYVLGRMLEEEFIDAATHQLAVDHPPTLQGPDTADFEAASYFAEEVRRRLVAVLGNEQVLQGGLVVETSLDLDLQHIAVTEVRRGLEALDQRRGYRGPLRQVALEDLAAEVERLALENELAAPESAEPLQLPAPGEAKLAVVLSVDDAAERARIAFGPGLEVDVALADVAWAHSAETGSHGSQVKRISQVFSAGDVTHFALAATEPEAPPRALLAQTPDVQGALLSFDVESGEVLALVGGYDFANSEFDRATQALRQPGSAFKPLVYAAALGHDYSPGSILYDRPVVYEDLESGFEWRPENYGRRFLGPLTMVEALARSVNNATIHLLRDLGIPNAVSVARQLGIRSPLEPNLAMALGSNAVTLLELTRAYGILAAGGRALEPRFIRRVVDRDGNLLLEDLPLDPGPDGPQPLVVAEGDAAAEPLPVLVEEIEEPLDGGYVELDLEPADAEPVLLPEGYAMDPVQAYLAVSLLRAVVEHPRGTGRRAARLGRPLGGKTGTTNDQGDAWFVGFSPEMATGVWVGFDEKQVLGRGETGGRAAAPIWIEYMEQALAERPVTDFPVPDGIVFARMDTRTGQLATPASETSWFQPFARGTEPKQSADAATTSSRSRRKLQLDF